MNSARPESPPLEVTSRCTRSVFMCSSLPQGLEQGGVICPVPSRRWRDGTVEPDGARLREMKRSENSISFVFGLLPAEGPSLIPPTVFSFSNGLGL